MGGKCKMKESIMKTKLKLKIHTKEDGSVQRAYVHIPIYMLDMYDIDSELKLVYDDETREIHVEDKED